MNWFKKAKQYVGYHGSPKEFQEFSYEFLGSNGTSEGFGFYFTNSEQVAKNYARGGYVKKAVLTINKPLSFTKLTISPASFSLFLRTLDPDGQGYLSNWGESDFEGYENLLRTAVREEMSGVDNDVDLISSIIQASGRNAEEVNKILFSTLGYDGIIINNPSWGNMDEPQIIYIVFSNNQIRYV